MGGGRVMSRVDEPGQTPTPFAMTGARFNGELTHYIRMRRLRRALFPGQWFADPVWDILLDLYLLEALGKPAFLTGIAASVPITTALRWTQRLAAAGLIDSRPDPRDGRRTILSLTDTSRQGLTAWAEQMFTSQPRPDDHSRPGADKPDGPIRTRRRI